ncbi:MAG: 3-isopropylmalate dehydrogenase, partial [Pseudorhodoplanes sp.]
MATHNILLLPGDGIGPEVMAEVEKLIAFFNGKGLARFETETGLVGGLRPCHRGFGDGDLVRVIAGAADAVLFGAVGGPKWDGVPYDLRPEAGLLR